MANPRIRFTPGFHIRFWSLDFFCTRVDHDLVQLPPSTSIHHAFLLGLDERVEGLDLIDMEGESALSIEPSGTLLNVNSISESMGGLCLHANEARAFRGLQLHRSDHPGPKRQHDTI
jgi:hypothetical protein